MHGHHWSVGTCPEQVQLTLHFEVGEQGTTRRCGIYLSFSCMVDVAVSILGLVDGMDPISAALGAGYTLLQALWNVKEACAMKRDNEDVAKELSNFILHLDQDLLNLKNKTTRSNSSVWAADALREDLEKATEYVNKCLKRGYFKSVWSVNTIQGKLKRIRENLSTSFQTKLQIIIFDVMIEDQAKQEEFQANLMHVQRSLTDSFSDSVQAQEDLNSEIRNINSNMVDLRSELRSLLQPVLDGLGALHAGNRGVDLESVISQIRSTEARTSDTEKFFADVVANLEGIKVRDSTEAPSEVPQHVDDSNDRWFEDPVTAEIMCDPVKCNDGRTYDRWTVIDNHLVQSPFDHSLSGFSIMVDDIDVRGRLFRAFPEQEEKFRARRARHRQEAFQHAADSEYGDALSKLAHVLQWARGDEDCTKKMEEVQHALENLKATEDEEPPTELSSGGSMYCRNAKGWYPSEFSVSWFASHTACPRTTTVPGLPEHGTLPGYYFEVHSEVPEFYVSIGFKLKDHEPPFLYEYGSGGRSDPGLGFAVPGGKCTELWKCDPVSNLKDDEAGALSFSKRILHQVMGAGINWAKKEVFFTRNGELTWVLLGAPQVDSHSKLYPAMSLDWRGYLDGRVRGENFGQRPFRFAFEKMFDPTFRQGLEARQVGSKGGSSFFAHARRTIGLS